MSCEVRTAGDLDAYAFGELSAPAARAVEAHLFGCAGCAAELRRLRAEQRLFRARLDAPAPAPPPLAAVLDLIDGAAPARPADAHPLTARVLYLDGAASGLKPRGAACASRPPLPFARSGRWAAAGSAAAAAVALAAAIAGVRLNGPLPASSAPRVEGDAPEISAEAMCEAGTPISVSVDPRASVAEHPAASTAAGAARSYDDPASCSPAGRGDVCGAAEVSAPSACDDAIAWCSGRP